MSARSSKMSARAGDLFSARDAPPSYDGGGGSSSGGGPAPIEEDNMNPLQLEHMLGYAGDYLKTVVCSATNENLFIRSMSSLVSIEDLTDPHAQQFLRGHDMPVSAIATSKSGQYIASSQIGTTHYKGYASPIFIWQASTGNRVVILKGLTKKANILTFSDDERFVAGCDEDCNCLVWDMSSSEVVASKKMPAPISVLMWVDQKKAGHNVDYELVVGCQHILSQALFTYDSMRMQWSIDLKPYQMPVSGGIVREFMCCVQTPDKVFICVGTTGGEMMVYRRDTTVFRAILPVTSNGLKDIVCLEDGTIVCGGGDGHLVKLRGKDMAWEVMEKAYMQSPILSLSVSCNKRELVIGCKDGTILRCLADTLTKDTVSKSHVSPVTVVAFSIQPASQANSQYLFVTGTSIGEVRVWDLTDYACVSLYRVSRSGSVLCLSLVDNSNILSGWEDGFVRCTNSGGQMLWYIANAHRDGVQSLSSHVNPDLSYFASGGGDGAVRVWKYYNRELVTQYSEHRKGVSQVKIDDMASNIVHSVGGDNSVLSYDLKANRRIIGHTFSGGQLLSLSQRIDSEQELITGDSMGRLLYWDIDHRDPVAVIQDPTRAPIRCCQVSTSGRYLAFAGDDQLLKVLDIRTTQMVTVGQSHSASIRSLAWTPDERQIVTGGDDCCLAIWNFFLADGGS